MDDLANPFGSLAAGTDLSAWLLPALIIAGLIFGLRVKTLAKRSMQASQERSMELSTRLASVDVEALLDDINAPSKPVAPNTDDFFANTARRSELSQNGPAEAPDMEDMLRKSMAAPSHESPTEAEPEPLFEIPTLQDLPRRSPNEPEVTEEAAARVKARLKEVEAKRQADPAYKPSRAEQVARYAVTAQRRDGGSAVYLKKGANVADIRRYKKAAEILGANDLAYILEHSADLIDAARASEDRAHWDEFVDSADQLSELFRTANETHHSTGRLVALADAYLSRHA